MSSTMTPTVLTVATLAVLLDTSTRTIYRLDSSGMIPKPIRLGGRPRWRRDEIEAWISAGMPSRETWETIRSLEDSEAQI